MHTVGQPAEMNREWWMEETWRHCAPSKKDSWAAVQAAAMLKPELRIARCSDISRQAKKMDFYMQSLNVYVVRNFKTLCGPNETHLQCRWDLRVASSEPLAWKKDVAYRRLRKGKRERHILKSCPLQRLDIHPSFWPTSIVIIPSGSSHDFWDNRPPPLAPCSSYATPVTGLIFLKYSSFVPPTSASAQKLEMTFLTAY